MTDSDSPERDERSIEAAARDLTWRLEAIFESESVLATYVLRGGLPVVSFQHAELDELPRTVVTHTSQLLVEIDPRLDDETEPKVHTLVGSYRVTVMRIGPRPLGYHVGVMIEADSPIEHSLWRLLRQLDRAFRKRLAADPDDP